VSSAAVDDRTVTMTEQQPAPEQAAASARPTLLARLGRDTAYALGAFPVALVGFVVVVAGVSVGLGSAVAGIGLVVLVATSHLARGLARVERLRMRSVLGRETPDPVYLVAGEGAGRVRRLLTPLRDPQSWLDLLWGLVGFVTGLLALVVTLSWWAGVLGGLSYGIWGRFLPDGPDDRGLAELLGLGNGLLPETLLMGAGGVLALLTLPLAVRAVAVTHAGTATVLLCGRAELQSQVRRATGGRDAARDAEAASLRRLERDIHDGPQQRLVRLTMDLGRARAQLGDDAGPVGATLDDAVRQARETLAELRALSRGIAPPLLVDRGLETALRELAQRSDVPVRLEVDLGAGRRELPPHVETALYFVVSEALANTNKHSGAGSAEVAVVADANGVVAAVRDDGCGGAAIAKGSGLAGLARRLTAVEGRLVVDSPDGGGTTLSAIVPCPREER
jgi:signal transduction histidine kinase